VTDSPLQKAPLGLLGALDLKTLGVNPDVFAGSVLPVVDAWEHYLADQLLVTTASSTIGIGTSGASVSPSVPVGYMWRLLAVGVSAVLNVADAAFTSSWGASIARSPDPTSAIIANLQTLGLAGSLSRSGGFLVPHPLVLQSGWSVQLAVALSANATVAVPIVGRLLVQQFQT
jgi:hypothetical protein